MNVVSFLPVVAGTASPTTGANLAEIAIRFWGLTALSRDQKKLLSHLGEAGTAVFAKEEVEYGGHDRTSLFDHDHVIISFVGQMVIWITASPPFTTRLRTLSQNSLYSSALKTLSKNQNIFLLITGFWIRL
jgi:hypothetical protein